MEKPALGKVMWMDLTVENADAVSDFYAAVVSWEKQALSMGDYSDYMMNLGEEGASGICHSKGVNAYLPPQWLVYIPVENLDASLEKCKSMGGKVIGEKRKMGDQGHYCLIQDPAGAYMMLCG